MHKIDPDLVVAGLHSAVKRHVVEPVAERRGRNASTKHAFEINNEVKRHAFHVIGVHQEGMIGHKSNCLRGFHRLSPKYHLPYSAFPAAASS